MLLPASRVRTSHLICTGWTSLSSKTSSLAPTAKGTEPGAPPPPWPGCARSWANWPRRCARAPWPSSGTNSATCSPGWRHSPTSSTCRSTRPRHATQLAAHVAQPSPAPAPDAAAGFAPRTPPPVHPSTCPPVHPSTRPPGFGASSGTTPRSKPQNSEGRSRLRRTREVAGSGVRRCPARRPPVRPAGPR